MDVLISATLRVIHTQTSYTYDFIVIIYHLFLTANKIIVDCLQLSI